jgi:capsular polysaccharide biosynthesis protein
VNAPDILKRLVRRFGLLVVLTLVGAIAGGVYTVVKTPTYAAQAYVVVTAEAGESIAAVNYAQAYGRIATTGAVADKAAAALGSRAGLNQVTASTSPDAPVIEITATGTNAKRTAAVANAVAQALVDFGATRKSETRVGLAVLTQASVPTSPSSPKPPLEIVVGAAGGLLIAGLAVLAGVGRPGGFARRPAPPVRYEMAPFGPTRPIQAARFPNGDGTSDRTHIAIASFGAGADERAGSHLESPWASESPINGRVVGRAVVIYRDER